MAADISSSQAISAGVGAAVKQFGSIHINVNTAGVIAGLSLVDSDGGPGDIAEFARLMAQQGWSAIRPPKQHS